MKFGIIMANWEPFSYSPSMYEEIAVKAEELGYDYFFVTDHFMRPLLPSGSPLYRHATIEAWTLLAYIAAKTSRIRLGTCVSPLPMRHPPILAKTVATLDVLSKGRAILGVGAGYDEAEFKGYSASPWEPPRERVKRTLEALRLMIALWKGEQVSFRGSYYTVEDAVLEPKPLQRPYPPIWMGAMGDAMISSAAQFADVWVPSRALGATLEFFREKSEVLKRESARLGRSVKTAIMGYVTERGVEPPINPIATMDEAREVLEKYAEVGCDYSIVMFYPAERYKQLMEKFWTDVASTF